MASTSTTAPSPPWRLAPVGWLLLLAGIGVLAAGLWLVDIHSALPAYRFRDLLWLALGGGLLAIPIRWMGRLPWLLAWSLALIAIHGAGLGVGQVLCVLLLATSAWCMGTWVSAGRVAASTSGRIIVGLAIHAAVIGWLLPYPIHSRLAYLVLLGLPILMQRRALIDAWNTMGAWRPPESRSTRWSLALLGYVLAMVATAAWLPPMMSDDVVYHLALPAQLVQSGYYHFNVADQIWAISPWANDVLHAIVMMLGGQTEIGALNTLWLLLGAGLMGRVLIRLGTDGAWAALGAALFFSVPLFHMSTNSMQTELASTAVTLAILERILMPVQRGDRGGILVMAILASFLLALKVSNGAILVPLLVWWLIRHRPFLLKPWLLGIVVGVLVGGSSYIQGWILTGNPVLPLFNSIFQSPLMPANDFSNPVYHGLLSWDVLFQATFDSSRFMESGDGTFGFQWLAGAGLLLVALLDRSLRPLLLCGLFGVLILFVQMQYLRYLLPALSLLAVALTVLLSRLRPEAIGKTLVTALCLLNLYFQCQSAPSVGAGTVTEVLRHGLDAYRTHLLRTIAPERLLLQSWRSRLGEHASVFAGTTANVAELAGRGHSVSWHTADFWTRMPTLEADPSGQAYLGYFRELGIDHVIVRPEFAGPGLMAAIGTAGEWLDSEGAAQLYRLHWPAQDMTQDPAIVLPDRAGLIQRYPVAGDRPWIGAAQVRLRCGKKGWGVSVTHVARGPFGERKLAPRISFCGTGHELVFDSSAALPDGTTEWEAQIQTFAADNPLGIIDAKAWLRPDAARMRDRASELRLF